MQSRIPLSIVFSAEGKRHAIPHCTFRVPAVPGRGATPSEAEKESVAFFHYLDSNDTRLPSHPHLRAYAQPAEEYETYVGEEVWETPADSKAAEPANGVSTHAGAARASDAADGEGEARLPPVPGFHGVVEWVNRVFDNEAWAADGVVLCGRYVVADDGAWVVPSRSPTLYCTREVFLLMRNSCKFLQDVHTQVQHAARAGAAPYFEFTLAKSLAGSGASEMRAVLPYPLHYSSQTQTWVTDDTAGSLAFTGIGQRMTDACFSCLMAWTEAEHDDHFRLMQRRVEQAALLERAMTADPHFISRLVGRFLKQRAATQPSAPLTLLLTVDLLFDAPTLPIYVLSAKARVFELLQRTNPAWNSLHETTAPWPLWTPLLKDTDPSASCGAERGTAVDGGATASCSADAQKESEGSEAESGKSDDDGESSGEEDDTLNFFRMFRDVAHWNQYVMAMVQRLHDAATDADSSPESNKPSRNVQHYCVVASESGDLVTCGDTLTKRGLPLELMHPELLELNEDAAVFLKMLRDGLFKKTE